jgi:hypothetical protein
LYLVLALCLIFAAAMGARYAMVTLVNPVDVSPHIPEWTEHAIWGIAIALMALFSFLTLCLNRIAAPGGASVTAGTAKKSHT